MDHVASIESQRRGFLSKSSFGMSFMQKEIGGGPASKFIYYLINTKYPIEQSDLINITHLPRRTIQSAIEDLRDQGFIIERNTWMILEERCTIQFNQNGFETNQI